MPADAISLPEALQGFGLSVDQINRLQARGLLTAHKRQGERARLFDRVELAQAKARMRPRGGQRAAFRTCRRCLTAYTDRAWGRYCSSGCETAAKPKHRNRAH